nr:basic proline-rich protein-like [Aegilops tauschii subsp. strangulata]
MRETSSVWPHRARDELGPAAPGHETSGGPQLGEDQPIDGSSARAPRRWGEGRDGPTADKPTPEKRPLLRTDPSSHREAATTPGGHHRDLPTPPPTTGAAVTPGRCPTRVARRPPSTGAAGHAPPEPRAAGRPPTPDPAGSGKRPAARHLPRREQRGRPAARGTKGARALPQQATPPPCETAATPLDPADNQCRHSKGPPRVGAYKRSGKSGPAAAMCPLGFAWRSSSAAAGGRGGRRGEERGSRRSFPARAGAPRKTYAAV